MNLMKRFILLLVTLMAAFDTYAAINAQYTFEEGLPSFLSVNGNAKIESSTEKFKDGSKSVKFSWEGPAELVFNNFTDIESSLKINESGIMMWVYNTCPMKEPIRFTILDWSMNEICHFDFNADFKGWRAIWMKYIDMLTPSGHYGDVALKERVTGAAGMLVKMPESAASGTIYIDRVTFSKNRLHNQITPDQQIPENNYNLERDMWQWCRLWEWEQYPMWDIVPVNQQQTQMLRTVEARLDEWAATGNPGKEYTAGTLLGRVDAHFEKYGIRRLPDGSVTGAPLLSDDEFNHSLGEMRIRFIQEIVYDRSGNIRELQ